MYNKSFRHNLNANTRIKLMWKRFQFFSLNWHHSPNCTMKMLCEFQTTKLKMAVALLPFSSSSFILLIFISLESFLSYSTSTLLVGSIFNFVKGEKGQYWIIGILLDHVQVFLLVVYNVGYFLGKHKLVLRSVRI